MHSYPDRYVAVLWPRTGDPQCICPTEWESTIRELGSIKRTRPYAEAIDNVTTAVTQLGEAIRTLVKPGGRLGLDFDRAPCVFADNLKAFLGETKLESCDELLRELRMTKTSKEVELLADVANRTDHGILGAIHHVIITSPRSEMSLAEEVRVHCLERELNVVGYHSLSLMASGKHLKRFWLSSQPRLFLIEHNVVAS